MSGYFPTVLILGHLFVKRLHRDLQSGFDHRAQLVFRASLHEPGLNTDPGLFSVDYHVYISPGWVRVGSFSADPGQFPCAGLKGLVTTCQ